MKAGPPEQLVGVESIEQQEAPVLQSSVSMAGRSNSAAPTCDCLAHVYGNAADRPERQRRYPTDMTDAEWAEVRPLLPVPGWMRGRALCSFLRSREPSSPPTRPLGGLQRWRLPRSRGDLARRRRPSRTASDL